jgi:monoamine oxidase
MTRPEQTDRWNVDIAVIGAGAAGIAAARYLRDNHPSLSIAVIEAAERTGGRSHTVRPAALGGEPVDLGCGWLHGARANEWTAVAEKLGFVVDRTPAPWDEGARQLSADAGREELAREAIGSFFDRAHAMAFEGIDRPLTAALDDNDPWNARIGAVGTFLNGAELEKASLQDYGRYDPGPSPDWRVRKGYGALISAYGDALPIIFDCPAEEIDHRPTDQVLLKTSKGTLRARAVIVTVSTNILAAEAIRFNPPLPAKTEAANKLPLGLANKLYIAFPDAGRELADVRLIGETNETRTGTYQLAPFGTPVIEGYYGGTLAQDLENAGAEAAMAFAVEELERHLGRDIARRLTLGAWSSWSKAHYARGSYSYAVPGGSPSREILAETVDGRLFFAGEACSVTRFSTAHGAFETGVKAAKEAALAVGSEIAKA